MIFLIGHRGVGKTSIAKSIEDGFDLDEAITQDHNIDELLESGGEKKFRDLERKYLLDLLKLKNPRLISLGAGFELDKFEFPLGSKFVWVQRMSDSAGRIFLDRPKLDKDKSLEKSFEDRKKNRDKAFSKYASFKLELREGAAVSDAISVIEGFVKQEKASFKEHGFYTLTNLPELDFIQANLELRTDFFSEEEIFKILDSEKALKILVAIRSEVEAGFLEGLALRSNTIVDIPVDYIEKGYLKGFTPENSFVSEHDFLSVDEIKKLNKQGYHVKWAPEVESFDDLVDFHGAVVGLDVSFLPRSVGDLKGRWNWYRQLTFHQNKVTFFRFGLNDYIDQPSYLDMSMDGELISITGQSGAVIGSDVSLSHSPTYHRDFINKHFSGTYVRVSLFNDEFVADNLDFLVSLGVEFLSVSSPFKDELGALGGLSTPMNTAFLEGSVENSLKLENTDVRSIEFLKKSLENYKAILVWGAGAIGKTIASSIGKRAVLQSIRSYEEGHIYEEQFDAVVWSAGSECLLYPGLDAAPKAIFDIEYKEHSQAKNLALLWGAEYISGSEFFKTQAFAQQNFWLRSKEKER